MSLTAKDTLAFQLIANKLNVLYNKGGDLSALNTIEKASFVAAINELKGLVDASQGSSVMIDDAAESLTTVYSSTKTKAVITADIAAALEGEDLSDLASSVAALAAADQNLVSASGIQTFLEPQKQQARDNIDAASASGLASAQTDIAANTTSIGNNTGSINTNSANITTNAGDIVTNASAITANQAAHVVNAAAHAANAAMTASNAAAIGDEAAYDPVTTINTILTF